MASTTLAATLSTPLSELRPVTMDRILVIEDDTALRKILHRPLVILSASPQVADKVLLLEMGADDYVTIPFSPRELVARLRALMRRASRVSPENLYFLEDVIVDFFKTEITRGGEKITVTTKEFRTLELLTKNPKRVISRDELLNEVWGYKNYPCTRTVDNHILRQR